jgi:hypothetical protein
MKLVPSIATTAKTPDVEPLPNQTLFVPPPKQPTLYQKPQVCPCQMFFTLTSAGTLQIACRGARTAHQTAEAHAAYDDRH